MAGRSGISRLKRSLIQSSARYVMVSWSRIFAVEVMRSGSIWNIVLPSLDIMDIMDMRPGGKRGIKKDLIICE